MTAANEYYIFTDFKTNKDNNRLHELRRIVNRSLHGENVKVLQAIDSEESVILQLQNILMGVVAYKFNYGDRGKSVAKNQLVRAVEEKLGCKIAPTYKCDRKFNIFKFFKGRDLMGLPELRKFTNEEECKKYYIEHYCNNTEIKTFDGICVRFYEETFEHAFYVRTRKS